MQDCAADLHRVRPPLPWALCSRSWSPGQPCAPHLPRGCCQTASSTQRIPKPLLTPNKQEFSVPFKSLAKYSHCFDISGFKNYGNVCRPLKMWFSQEREGWNRRWWALIHSSNNSETRTREQPPLFPGSLVREVLYNSRKRQVRRRERPLGPGEPWGVDGAESGGLLQDCSWRVHLRCGGWRSL